MDTKKKCGLQMIIAFIVLWFIFQIGPMHAYSNHIWSKGQTVNAMGHVELTKDRRLIQHIKFQHDHIKSMTCYLSTIQHDEFATVYFRLYDDTFACIYQEEIMCGLIDRDGKVTLSIDLDVDPTRDYFYEWFVPIEDIDNHEQPRILSVPLVNGAKLEQLENIACYLDGVGSVEYAMQVDFDYTYPFGIKKQIFYSTLVVMIGALSYGICYLLLYTWRGFSEKKKRNIKLVCSVIMGVCFLVALILSVLLNIFGGNWDDRVIFLIGIISLFFWGFHFIWREEKQETTQDPHSIWRNGIQTICFCLAMIATCNYVNVQKIQDHVINNRRFIIWMIIASLCSLNYTEWKSYIKKKYENTRSIYSWMFLCVYVVFMCLLIANRQEKTWPFTMLVFALFLFTPMNKKQRNKVLDNFGNGVYLSYFITFGYALLHRPYNTWTFYRYQGMFHTVAYTGMYLSMVVAISLAKITNGVKEKKKFHDFFNLDLFVFSTACGFILISMTRTAMLALAIMFLLVIILVLCVQKNSVKQICAEFGILCVVGLTSFCIVFSSARIIPALVNEPEYLAAENANHTQVQKGEKIDSSKYLRFQRYISILFGRLGASADQQACNEDDTLLVCENQFYIPIAVAVNSEASLNADISNGRTEIFKAYLKNITWDNHEGLHLYSEDGAKLYAHAHNAYLQIPYSFGLFAGILFGILCLCSFISSILYYVQNKDTSQALMPFMIVVVFGITSLVEWTYQPCIPIGFCFMMIQAILMQRPVEANAKK